MGARMILAQRELARLVFSCTDGPLDPFVVTLRALKLARDGADPETLANVLHEGGALSEGWGSIRDQA